jgi:signal transduction histidine kinase
LSAQEALANVARHAQAEQVLINIEAQDNHVILRVSDDGRGFDIASKSYSVGHGLSNMRARAEDLDGSFAIQSVPGKGTTVNLRFPIEGKH